MARVTPSLLLSLYLVGAAHAQFDEDFTPKKQPPKAKEAKKYPGPGPKIRLPERAPRTPDGAVSIALEDARLHSQEAPFFRYLWVPDANRETVRGLSLAVNTVSRSSFPSRPVALADGQVLRVDLRRYSPLKQLPDYIGVWENLQFDPFFNLLITKDTIKAATAVVPGFTVKAPKGKRLRIEKVNWREVTVPKYWGMADSGKMTWLTTKWAFDLREVEEEVSLAVVDVSNADVIRLNGPHLNANNYSALQQLTQSAAPIVHHQYFVARALTSIQGKGTYKVVFGGLYYDFVGVKGQTLTQILKTFGVDRKVFDELPSEQRAAVFRSGVTGRPRQVEWFPTLATRDGLVSFAFITSDIGSEDVEVSQHPVRNLLKPKIKAREAIFGRPNGTHLFLLADAEEKQQEQAPPDVARNYLAPRGHTTKLEGAIDCMWCHAIESRKFDGWQPLHNDVSKLRKKVDIFGDISDLKKTIPDSVDELASRYTGTPDRTLRLARDAYSESVLWMTGPWKDGGDQVDIVFNASKRLIDVYSDWRYPTISAQRALYDLGIDVPKEKAAAVLEMLLAPDPRENVGGIVPEDIVIVGLYAGAEPDRFDYSFAYSYIATRVQKNLGRLK